MMGLFLSQGISLHLTGFFSRLPEWFPGVIVGKAKLPPKEKQRRKEKAPLLETPVPERRRRHIGPAVISSMAVFALVAFGGTTLIFSFSQLEYGIGMTEHKFSFPAAEFLRKNPVPGRMFNFFDIGGFLDWQLYPQALTFIDGRTYNQEVFIEHQVVTGAMPGWERVLEKYGINYIVLKSMDSSGMILPIIPKSLPTIRDGRWSSRTDSSSSLSGTHPGCGDISVATRSRRGSFRSTLSRRRTTTCFSGSPPWSPTRR